jgi:hypothetical protein
MLILLLDKGFVGFPITMLKRLKNPPANNSMKLMMSYSIIDDVKRMGMSIKKGTPNMKK